MPGYKWEPIADEKQPASGKVENNYTDKIIEEALVAENPSNKEMNGYFDSAMRGKIKLPSPSETLQSEIGSSKKVPTQGEPAPEVKGTAWGALIKEGEWNPLIKIYNVNVLQ
jgi:hypothetical protein